ncbi:hypothetical protein CWB94_23970, partial [Pseudoalteromonas piscicida]
FKLTLLYYPDFETYAYPQLHTSITVNLLENTFKITDYQSSNNPPILHRKVAFVLPNHPLIEQFKQHTREGEQIG